MAASSSATMSTSFKVPSEPCPLPSLGSDEESFVVLGKSLISDFEQSPIENNQEPVGSSIIQEAKQLISKELSQIGQSSKEESLSDKNKNEQIDKQLWSSAVDTTDNTTSSSDKQQMEQSSVLPVMPNVVKNFNEDNPSNTPISIVSFSTSDINNVETQSKIAQIIDENVHLKNTILQNNASMKSQYERIVAWQEDVQKVHESHKQKFLEAKQYIEKLKQENYTIKQNLENEREHKNALELEIVILKNIDKDKEQDLNEKLVQSTENNLKAFELEHANKKIKELETALEESKVKIREYEVAIENSKDLEKRINELTSENMELERKRKDTFVAEEKLRVATETIDKLKKEVDCLTLLLHQLRNGNSHEQEMNKMKCEENEKRKALDEEILSLRTQLALANQQQRIQVPANVEEMSALRHQLMNMQMSLTQNEHSRVAAFSQVEALKREIEEMKKQVAEAQVVKDDAFALKTQLDVYKADFEAEREAKETVKAENTKLSEDLQHLQRRNQQLQEEIELFRERDYVHVGRPSSTYQSSSRRGRESTTNESPSAPTFGGNTADPLYKCPKCSFGFRTVPALENHVYRCIDLDDQLP